MWKRLQHPNIVPFLGVPNPIPQPFEVACGLTENGRITEYVRRNPDVDRIGLVSGPTSATPPPPPPVLTSNVAAVGRGKWPQPPPFA